jgi:subtilisin
VAGVAAAKDNSQGVVGLAPGARLWAIKVLDGNGIGLLLWR